MKATHVIVSWLTTNTMICLSNYNTHFSVYTCKCICEKKKKKKDGVTDEVGTSVDVKRSIISQELKNKISNFHRFNY